MAPTSKRRETAEQLLANTPTSEQRSIAAITLAITTGVSETAATHIIDRIIACKERTEPDTMILLRLDVKRGRE